MNASNRPAIMYLQRDIVIIVIPLPKIVNCSDFHLIYTGKKLNNRFEKGLVIVNIGYF